MEGNLRFNIDWASHLVGSKFSVFALFYLVFEGNFPSTSPRAAYIWRGDLTDGFLRYRFGGLIFGGAYFGILRYYTQFSIILSNLLLLRLTNNSGILSSARCKPISPSLPAVNKGNLNFVLCLEFVSKSSFIYR